VAEQWFLKIDGIEGESPNDLHKGEIDVESWSWGVQSGSPASGAGLGGGRATFQDLSVAARISKASPSLFLACVTGAHHTTATLSGTRSAGKSVVDYLEYTLSDVLVTSVQHSGSEAGVPMEQFSLQYGKFEISYAPLTPSGKVGPTGKAGFDVQQNQQL